MPIIKFLQKAEKFEIQIYKKPQNIKDLKETHVAFSGSPRKHPYDSSKVILLTDPYSSNTFYYEFNKEDIKYVEELPKLVSPEETTIPMTRIWVKKQSIGIRCTPFIVEDIRTNRIK